MRLAIELVPRPCWHKSLAKLHALGLFPEWDKIRTEAILKFANSCAFCGASHQRPTRFPNVHVPAAAPLHCHEVWHYDDQNCVQTLVDVVPVCNMCHHVKHLGLAEILASEGKLDFKKVIEHFLAVNDAKPSDFEREAREAFSIFNERSKKEWTTHFGPYNALVDANFVKDWNLDVCDEAIGFEEEQDHNKPSTVISKTWVNAFSRKHHAGKGAGSWLIKGTVQEIDDLWPLVKEATEQGSLGVSAFASTAAFKGRTRVIGVVTGHGQDIYQVAQQVAGLGYSGSVEWKNSQTKKIEHTAELGGFSSG